MLEPVRLFYTTPDLPGPVLVDMFVASHEDENAYDFRRKALNIAEITVQSTLKLYGVRASWDDED